MDQWRSRLWSLQPDPASPRPRESSLTSSPLSPTLPSEVRYGGPVAGGRAGSVGPSFVVVVNVESGVTSDGFPPCHRAGTHGARWLAAHSFSLSSSSAPLAPPLCCYYPLFRHHKQASEMFATFKLVLAPSSLSSVRPPSASYALACAALLLLLLWYSIVAPQRNECTRPRRPPRPQRRRAAGEGGGSSAASIGCGGAGGQLGRPARSRWPRAASLLDRAASGFQSVASPSGSLG